MNVKKEDCGIWVYVFCVAFGTGLSFSGLDFLAALGFGVSGVIIVAKLLDVN